MGLTVQRAATTRQSLDEHLALVEPGRITPQMVTRRFHVAGGGRADPMLDPGSGNLAVCKKLTLTNQHDFALGYIIGSNNGHCYAYPGTIRPYEAITFDTAIVQTQGEDLSVVVTAGPGSVAAGNAAHYIGVDATWMTYPTTMPNGPRRIGYVLAVTQATGSTTIIATTDTRTWVITQLWVNSRGPNPGWVSVNMGAQSIAWIKTEAYRPTLLDLSTIVTPGQGLTVSMPATSGSATDIYIMGYEKRVV